MEATKSTRKYWIWFVIWLVIMVLLMIFLREYFWLALPGVVTYFSKGMDIV